MKTRPALRALATVTAAVTAVLVLAPASQAERARLDDGADAPASSTDIREVRVRHSDHWVRTVVNFPNLRKQGDASLSIFFDTDGSDRGPEYGVGLPLFSGADYMLTRQEGWKGGGDDFVNCSYGARFDWADDRVVFRARRGCFDRPDRVRVGMLMVDWSDENDLVRDWLIGRRDWTRWLDSGKAA